MENEIGLEGKVKSEIIEMRLEDFDKSLKLWKSKEMAQRYVSGLLGHLYAPDGKHYYIGIRKVGDLYKLPPERIKKMQMYGKKTFLSLNKLLTQYGLPVLELPKEYISSPHAYE